jgi:hypothetical protein
MTAHTKSLTDTVSVISGTPWRIVAPQAGGSEIYILSVAVLNGKIYGGTYPNGRLYEWNGVNAWVLVAPMAGGTETQIRSLCVLNGKIYGGTSLNGGLYEWNGVNAWVLVAPQAGGTETEICSLTVLNGKIYGGTQSNGRLYEWNGVNAWVLVAPMAGGTETQIRSLCVLNGKIYGGTNPTGRLYEWNGVNAWVLVAPQAGGTETQIRALCVLNGKIYGGTYPNGRLYEWNGVNAWVLVAPMAGGTETQIRSLCVLNGKIYSGTYPNGRLYEWDGVDEWVLVASQAGRTEIYIFSLAVLNGKIYGGTGDNGRLYEWSGLVRTSTFARNITETITSSDLFSRFVAFKRSIADNLTIVQTLLQTIGTFSLSFSEVAISVSDSVSKRIGKPILALPIKVSELLKKVLTYYVHPYPSFDPREAIRTVITTDADPNATGTDQSVITIRDSVNNEYHIPIYLSEETKSSNSPLPTLPLIELGLVHESAKPQDIGASTRKHEAYIDVHVYWQKSDDMAQNKFGKLISDEICYQIRSNQCGVVPYQYFMNVNSTGRVFTESNARQVVYHRLLEIYVLWYD